MILFQRVHFHNFRILRDVEIDFSTDEDKPLTVIRGENESGKTSMLWGMQWAFFGDAILPDEGRGFRLHPIDWNLEQGRCTISVEIAFEAEDTADGGGSGLSKRYSVNRQCVEEVDSQGKFSRHSHTLTLYEHNERGSFPKPHPELVLNSMFPRALAEVFFTDGARVLSFTGADLSQTTKRKRVQDAIRNLLGLDLLQEARKHVQFAYDDINTQLKETSADQPLKNIATRIEAATGEQEKHQSDRDKAVDGLGQVELMLSDATGRLDAALARGNKEELASERQSLQQSMARSREQIGIIQNRRSDLFRDDALSAGLLRSKLVTALGKLADMKDRALIPRNFLPILEERIAAGTCICGTPLNDGDPHLDHVRKLVEEQKNSDDVTSRLSDLVPAARRYVDPEQSGTRWISQLTELWRVQESAAASLKEAQTKDKALDLKIKSLPDTDIAELRRQRMDLENQKVSLIERRASAETHLTRLRKELDDLNQQRNTFMRMKSKYVRQRAQLQAAEDVGLILHRAYTTIQTTQVKAVSDKMNEYFLQMIGSSEEHGIIQKAEISDDFDIFVYGPMRRRLDPDRDLNGASRRALTLAFILAVTSVSGVPAPSVIDTPISELSGAVRSEVLRLTARLSPQLILFLTRADISGVETIIDEFAGKVVTLSNSKHYPQYLINVPHTQTIDAIVCSCNHREYCEVCERQGDSSDEGLHRRHQAVEIAG